MTSLSQSECISLWHQFRGSQTGMVHKTNYLVFQVYTSHWLEVSSWCIWSFYFLVLNCEQSRWCGLLYLLIRKLWGFNQKVSSNDDRHRLCHCPFLPTYDCFICSHFEFNLSSSVEEFAFWLTLTRVPSTICFNIFGLLDAFTALLCCGFVGWLQTEETINYFRHRRGWFKTIFRDIFT